jgi:putative endonuclease
MWFLDEHGVEVVGRNIEVPGGELDLLALDEGQRLAVEVRTRVGGGDPIDAVGYEKRRHVRRLASSVGAARTDLVGVRVSVGSVDVHWVPGV